MATQKNIQEKINGNENEAHRGKTFLYAANVNFNTTKNESEKKTGENCNEAKGRKSFSDRFVDDNVFDRLWIIYFLANTISIASDQNGKRKSRERRSEKHWAQ